MLRFLRRNPLLFALRQPFPLDGLTINGAVANNQNGSSPFTAFYFFSSSAASNLRNESAQIQQPILDFFHSYGFSDAQIKKCVHRCPTVRSIEIIKPKFERLLAFGFSPSEIVRTICFHPNILASSLKERIEPNLSLLEATFGSKTNVIQGINHGPWLLIENLEKHVIPNLKLLRENNIPTDKINRLFTRYPHILYKHPDIVVENINKLKGLGMCLSNLAFIHAMHALCGLKKETWDRKMEFFKEKLECDSTMVLKWPLVLTYSLGDRIIPRCAVLNSLAKNGLWNGKSKLSTLFTMAERNFKERFVDKHKKEVPQVIDAYQGKIEFTGFVSTVDVSLFKS